MVNSNSKCPVRILRLGAFILSAGLLCAAAPAEVFAQVSAADQTQPTSG